MTDPRGEEEAMRRRMLRRAGCFYAFLLPGLLLTLPLGAQDPPPSVLDASASLFEVTPGYRVRLSTGAEVLDGRWLAPESGIFRIETEDGARTVPLDDVQDLRVQTTNARRGAILGAVVGAIASGLFVGVLAEGLCEVDCEGAGEFLYGLVVGGGVGAVGGGIAGGVLGSWILTWRPAWP